MALKNEQQVLKYISKFSSEVDGVHRISIGSKTYYAENSSDLSSKICKDLKIAIQK